MFKLAVILMKSFGDSVKGKSDKAKSIKKFLMYGLITLAMLPTAIGIGMMAFGAGKALATIGQGAMVLGLGMTIVTMTVFFFGIFYVLSVFYFAKDVETLLPLPLSSGQIVGAKFLVTLVYEYLTELVVLVPIIIGYGISAHAGFGYYAVGVIIFLLLPIAPLSFASVLDMFIMSFTNLAKNKDRFRLFSAMFGLVLALGINFGAQKLGQDFSSPEAMERLLTEGNNSMLGTLSKLFPTNKLAVLAMVSEPATGILNLGLFLGAMVVCFGFFYWISGLLYFRGAVGVNESGATRKKLKREDYERETRTKGSLLAVYMKELRLLTRNPGYFVNCVVMNFLFPVFLILPFIAGGEKIGPNELNQMKMIVLNPGAAFLAAAFVTATNSIGCSAISREGRLLYISKFLPIDPKTHLNGKLLTALVFGSVASVLLVVVEAILFRATPVQILVTLIIMLLATVFTAVVGLLMDIAFPKLHWDNELKAVKQNMNVLFLMLISVLAGGLTLGGVLVLQLNYVWSGILVIALFTVVNALLYSGLMTIGATAYSKLEV